MAYLQPNPKSPQVGYYLYEGIIWSIFHYRKNNKNYFYENIINCIFRKIKNTLGKYKRITSIIMVLHCKKHTQDNKLISIFISNFLKKLNHRYKTKAGFMWVREHGKSASQHYHVCVFLDQKKCNSYYGVYMDAVRLWECALDFGKVSEVKNGCLFAKDFDFDAIQTMVLRLSYFAKMKTKNPSYDGIKRFHSDHTF